MRKMWPNRLRKAWRAVSDARWAAQFELRPSRRSTRWRARAQGVGSVPPSRKKMMNLGMGIWGLLGIAARSHGGHRVFLAPSWVHEIFLGPSWDRLEVTMGAW